MKIAFLGQMRSGKDTAAKYLINKYGGNNAKFTDPLYKIQKAVYEIVGQPEPEKDRRLLQLVGTDWGRDTISETIWIDLLINNLKPSENTFVTDLRFINEAKALKDVGFVIVKIIRLEKDRVTAGATNTSHRSEMEVDAIEYDYIVENISDLNHLHSELDKIVQDISSRSYTNDCHAHRSSIV